MHHHHHIYFTVTNTKRTEAEDKLQLETDGTKEIIYVHLYCVVLYAVSSPADAANG